MKKVVFIGAHPDDIELGCAGTIYKNRDDWDISCHILISNDAEKGRSPPQVQASLSALTQLGVSNIHFYDGTIRNLNRQWVWETLTNIVSSVEPDIVFVPDAVKHRDHVIINEVSLRNIHCDTIVYDVYDIISNPNYFERLNADEVEMKISILQNFTLFQSRYYFQDNYIRSLLCVYGGMIQHNMAEGFRQIRRIR